MDELSDEIEIKDYVNFSDCVIVCSEMIERYFYAPQKILQNEIDIKLFSLLISNPYLKKFNNIKIESKMYCINLEDQYCVGNIYIRDNKHVQCLLCKKGIPFDLGFFTLEKNFNLCEQCYKISDNISNYNDYVYKIKKSGLDNLSDWFLIFTIKINFKDEFGYNSNDNKKFYCNLNKNSVYYKRFAVNYYVDMLGDKLKILHSTSIEELYSVHFKI